MPRAEVVIRTRKGKAKNKPRIQQPRRVAKNYIGPLMPNQVRGNGDYKMFGFFGPNVKSKYNSLSSALVGKARGFLGENAGKIGTYAGNLISPAGGAIGGAIGTQLGPLISGSGTYKMNKAMRSPFNTGKDIIGGAPIFSPHKSPSNASNARWRECIGVVNASNGNCVTTTYTIQPSNQTTFPWGARRGPMYRKYDPRGLIIEYESTSSPIGVTTAALGDVVIFSQSRNDEPVPTSVVDCMTMSDGVYGNPSQSLLLGIECSHADRQYNQYYCSDGTPQISDPSRFDFGTFTICVQCPGATTTQIGRLWISADIDFIDQIPLDTWPILSNLTDFTASGTAGTQAAPLSNAAINYPGLGVTIPSTTTVVHSNPGNYLMLLTWAGASSIAAVPSIVTGSAIQLNALFNAGTTTFNAQFLAAGTSSSYIIAYTIKTVGVGAQNTFTVGGNTGMTGGNWTVNVCAVPSIAAGYISSDTPFKGSRTVTTFCPSNLVDRSIDCSESKFPSLKQINNSRRIHEFYRWLEEREDLLHEEKRRPVSPEVDNELELFDTVKLPHHINYCSAPNCEVVIPDHLDYCLKHDPRSNEERKSSPPSYLINAQPAVYRRGKIIIAEPEAPAPSLSMSKSTVGFLSNLLKTSSAVEAPSN